MAVFDFHFCSSLSYITHLEADFLVSIYVFACVCVCVCVCVCMCVRACVCLAVSLSIFMHQRHLIFQRTTTTMVSSCSPYKQTYPCLQMKTNIDEIKLGEEYLISELNVWIKLCCLYWIKPVGIGSMSSIWENRGRKTFLFSVHCFSSVFSILLLAFTFCPCVCVSLVLWVLIRWDGSIGFN